MIFLSPFWLLGLLPVAAAAIITFLRPARREVLVGSLVLWQVVVRVSDAGGTKTDRRIPPGWVLLLVGATLAVLALASPVWKHPPEARKKTNVPLSMTIPSVTFGAAAGETQPDGQAEIFVRLRNRTDQTFTGSLSIRTAEGTAPPATIISIPARGAVQTIQAVPDSPALTIHVNNDSGEPVDSVNLRRTNPGLTRIATMGDVGAILHRYLQADDRLALVSTAAEADVVIAQGVLPPKNVAAILLAPPISPPGWRRGEQAYAVTLESADVAADDPVMKDVNVATMAVRNVPLWPPGHAAGKAVLELNHKAIIVRSTPEQDPTNSTPRCVYVSFAITPENTNIEEAPGAFVTLLANAIRRLHPVENVRGRYVRETLNRGAFPRRSDETGTAVVGASHNMERCPWLIVAAMLCWILGWRRCAGKTG